MQVIYNIFDQSPEDDLFPACERNNIGVIVRVPFDEGALTGKVRPDTVFPEGDFRNDYFKGTRKAEAWERAQKIAADLEMPPERLPEIALRFCLAAEAVSTVIPGMRSVGHVETNAAVSDAGPLAPDLLERLRPHRCVHDWYH